MIPKPSSYQNSDKKLFILTFDLEEWFHILDIDSLDKSERWEKFEVRIYKNTQRILDLLKENKLRTTFFVLGWVAKKYPEIVRSIADQGHEIGSHSLNHTLVFKNSPNVFEHDLRRSIDIIQDITNKKVRIFRAPGFSITRETFWVFDILIKAGIEIDSSIFPAPRGHGGIKDFNLAHPFCIRARGGLIKEFPLNIYRIGKLRIPYSGGGYFRIIPFPAILYFSNRSDYLITYFHPRDFDPGQPVLKELPLMRRLKSYTGLNRSLKRLKTYIKKYHFVDISAAEKRINWYKVPEITV